MENFENFHNPQNFTYPQNPNTSQYGPETSSIEGDEKLSAEANDKEIIREMLLNKDLGNFKNFQWEDNEINGIEALVQDLGKSNLTLNNELETRLKVILNLYSHLRYLVNKEQSLNSYNLEDAEFILDSIAGTLVSVNYFSFNELLECFLETDLIKRILLVHKLLAKYVTFMNNYTQVENIAKQNLKQRKMQEFMKEVYNVAKTAAVGEKDKSLIIKKFNERLEGKELPENIKKIYDSEIQRYLTIDDNSPEANIIRTYLEWISWIPFGVSTKDNWDIKKAVSILDSLHYGMKDVKERILEFIAVSKLKGNLTGKILLLHGPPGVGKTSLASSIAKSMGRKFYRISLGGESDSSVLKGHRKTYIGAYPGKLVHALKDAQTENCVILLDEIDKVGTSNFSGDPQSNLLEILDPEQNKSFTDNYLDFPIDLSKILFICSANTLDTISPPLLDRMDRIALSSYTTKEKRSILLEYLLPRLINDANLKHEDISISESGISTLISEYCREPGVRGLEKESKRLIEKIALAIYRNEAALPIELGPLDIKKYLGKSKFPSSKIYQCTPKGVVVGLAYTSYGGSLIFIEAVQTSFLDSKSGPSSIKSTGSLGAVIQESFQIAYSFSRNFLQKLENNYLETNNVHIHAPEGATPKDGPSAGITVTTALISLALGRPAKQGIAMTGEISLNGKVMPIGGVKEKVLAAQREGIKELIFPMENRDEVLDLDDDLKSGIKFNYAKEYNDVYEIMFSDQRD